MYDAMVNEIMIEGKRRKLDRINLNIIYLTSFIQQVTKLIFPRT